MANFPHRIRPSTTTTSQPQVFSDPNRQRLIWVRALFFSAVLVVVCWIVVFATNLASLPNLRGDVIFEYFKENSALDGDVSRSRGATLLLDELVTTRAETGDLPNRLDSCAWQSEVEHARQSGQDSGPKLFAFLLADTDWSYLSLERECGMIGTLAPEWFTVGANHFALERVDVDPSAHKAITEFTQLRGEALDLFPTVRIGIGVDASKFWQDLENKSSKDLLIDNLVIASERTGATGICLDITTGTAVDWNSFNALLRAMSEQFRTNELSTCVVMPSDNIDRLSKSALAATDLVVMRGYQQPWVGSPPGALVEKDWFEGIVRRAVQAIGTEKLTVALGTSSTDWISGRPMPEEIGFSEALTRIAEANAQVRFSKGSGSSFSSFLGKEGLRHEIWMQDAVTAHNQMLVLAASGVEKIGLSGLGYEDPGVWTIIGRRSEPASRLASQLRNIYLDNYVSYSGQGPFLHYDAPLVAGQRSVEFEPTTWKIVQQNYLKIPAAAKVRRYGKAAPNKIVLTFDDGPHPEYTRQILDILQTHDVPAAFFLVGNNAAQYTDIVKRMVRDGHEIGSHTFMHPRMDQISNYRAVAEANAVQKLINGITGRSMLLYREPFMRGDGPLTAQRAEPIRMLQSAGYIVAGSEIVPKDWQDTSAEEIVSHVLDQVSAGKGNVVVLHDAGRDRSETVRAVPLLIERLRAEGYEFASMAEALGVQPEDIMPVIKKPTAGLDDLSFQAIAGTQTILVYLFWAAIAIGVVRSLAVIVMALMRRQSTARYAGIAPSVSIIIPAFNEELVIEKSVRRALESDYPDLKVIVVDDGSKDQTLDVLRAQFGDNPRVRIFSQPNAGKWAALNLAYRVVDTEIAVCIDADTQIDRKAVVWLCRHFSDPKIGAVAGNILVGNRNRILTRLQALEYITAQSIDRRAAELINGMLVVPGAIGAWRVEAVRAAGLYSPETLSEDADLTVAVVRSGYQVVFEENAIAQTEAPAKVGPFLQQRLRWSLGMLQVGWKHRRAMSELRPIGLVSLTDLAVFGYLFPIIAPLADAFFLYFLFELISAQWADPSQFAPAAPSYLFLGYLALPLMDILTSAVAIIVNGRERWTLLLLFPFQRLFYRQLLYLSVFSAIFRAITGKLAKWQKADRYGFVAMIGSR